MIFACAANLSGCATDTAAYPRLGDMPSVPTGTTPEAERERIIKDLEQQKADEPAVAVPGTTDRKQPAVPPKPGATNLCAEDQIALAVPALRGTLHGGWQAPEEAPANPPAFATGEGVTAAIAPPFSNRLKLAFAAGTASLDGDDIARLRTAAAHYAARAGGEPILIQTRGGRGISGEPLAGVSLGLERAASIADALIAGGVAANQIKIAAAGADAAPSLADATASIPAPDSAVVIFN
jgi:outer membrane protein OmpA-like peptidoglycan-associated protein